MRWLALAVALAVIGAGTAAALIWGQGGAHAGNPFAIKKGMSVQQVRSVAGSPDQTYVEHLGEYARIRARNLTGQVVRTEQCWFYKATKKNTSYDGAGACFFRGRVLDVTRGVHG